MEKNKIKSFRTNTLKRYASWLIAAALAQNGAVLAAGQEKSRPLGQINEYLRIKGQLLGSYEA